MFIVIEGTDASGKSSLIAEINKQLGDTARLFHKGKPEVETRRWVLDEYVINVSKEYSASTDDVFLADRWHWGEVTYAPLKRAHTDKDGFGLLGISGWRWVELFLMSRGVAQFWLYQPLEVISKRLGSRGDDYVEVGELESILRNYMVAMGQTASCTHLQPNPSSIDEIPELAAKVIEIAKDKQAVAKKLSRYSGYIGSPKPDVLLVGDKRNDKTITSLPFMPISSNSGDYLLSCLPSPFWKNIGIINGDDINGKPLEMLWNTLGKPRIVALGRMAEKYLTKSGFEAPTYNVVPHPQYVRRFHHHDRIEYGAAIERLAKEIPNQGDPWILQ